MCRVRDSNPRQKDFQSFALPTELTRQVKISITYDKKKSTHFLNFILFVEILTLLQKNKTTVF